MIKLNIFGVIFTIAIFWLVIWGTGDEVKKMKEQQLCLQQAVETGSGVKFVKKKSDKKGSYNYYNREVYLKFMIDCLPQDSDARIDKLRQLEALKNTKNN